MIKKIMLLAIFVGCSMVAGFTVEAAPYDGNWSGTTDQGYEVSFVISDNKITAFSIEYRIYGSYCSVTKKTTITSSQSIAPIVGNSFTISGRSYDSYTGQYNHYEYVGTFVDSFTCSGTWFAENAYCDGSGSGTWEANKAVKGDLNGDGEVNLDDAILAHQVLSGMQPQGLNKAADVDGDGRIGAEEATYVLQVVSGLRNP